LGYRSLHNFAPVSGPVALSTVAAVVDSEVAVPENVVTVEPSAGSITLTPKVALAALPDSFFTSASAFSVRLPVSPLAVLLVMLV
jgi:hypothetical protein